MRVLRILHFISRKEEDAYADKQFTPESRHGLNEKKRKQPMDGDTPP
jgi:hypothetical protein